MNSFARSIAFTIGVTALAGACAGSSASSAPKACTLIGCDNTVQLLITGAGASSVTRISVSAPGDTAISRTCSASAPCTGPNGVVFSYAPDTLIVTLTTNAGTSTFTEVPAYTLFSPNGPDCPPTCKTATVAITVPA